MSFKEKWLKFKNQDVYSVLATITFQGGEQRTAVFQSYQDISRIMDWYDRFDDVTAKLTLEYTHIDSS